MSSDIRSILQRLAMVEGATSPVTVKHGLTDQQQSVPQLPALFKPKRISVLDNPQDPKHPAAGYAVGAAESTNQLQRAMNTVEEDMLSKVKRDFTNYLDRLERKVKDNRGLSLPDSAHAQKHQMQELDQLPQNDSNQDAVTSDDAHPAATNPTPSGATGAPVKTVAMEDGRLFEIHGDEVQGFEVRFGPRKLSTRFPKLDHAQTAIELFKAQRRNREQDSGQDYIEER